MTSRQMMESLPPETAPESRSIGGRRRRPRLLLVDSNAAALKVLAVRLKLTGFRCSLAQEGKQALQHLQQSACDAVLLDLKTSKLCGAELTREIRFQYPATAVILLANTNEAYGAVQGIKEGADDCLIKPLNAKELLRSIRRVIEQRRRGRQTDSPPAVKPSPDPDCQPLPQQQENSDAYENTLLALGTALDLRDSRTAGHSRRVCMYSLEIAQRMKCSPQELKILRQGALLHDIGKLAIPDAILWKPGPLTPEEWTIMKTHVQAGYEMVRSIPLLQSAAELILTHHERHDGTGYPRGLCGQDIPLCSRIFAVADTFDAMTTARPYQEAVPLGLAREEIRRSAATCFDAVVAEAFLSIPMETLDFIHQTYHSELDCTSSKWREPVRPTLCRCGFNPPGWQYFHSEGRCRPGSGTV